MSRFRSLFLLGSLGISLLFWFFAEKLRADDSVMKKIYSITDECLKSTKSIRQGELTLFFSSTHEIHSSFAVQKHLGIVFDGERMLVTHKTERTVVYAFNCYKPGTLAYFRTSPPNVVGSPPPANLNIQDFHLDSLEIFPFPMDIEIGKDLSDLNKVVDSKEFTIPNPVTLCRIGQTTNSISVLSKVKTETPEAYFDSFKKNIKKTSKKPFGTITAVFSITNLRKIRLMETCVIKFQANLLIHSLQIESLLKRGVNYLEKKKLNF